MVISSSIRHRSLERCNFSTHLIPHPSLHPCGTLFPARHHFQLKVTPFSTPSSFLNEKLLGVENGTRFSTRVALDSQLPFSRTSIASPPFSIQSIFLFKKKLGIENGDDLSWKLQLPIRIWARMVEKQLINWVETGYFKFDLPPFSKTVAIWVESCNF